MSPAKHVSAPDARTRVRRGILGRAVAAWGAAFVLALGSAGMASSIAGEYDSEVRRLAEETAMERLLGDVLQMMVDRESAQRGYAITGDPAFLEDYLESDDELPEAIRELQTWLDEHGEDDEARELAHAIRERDELTRSVVRLVRDGRLEDARERIGTGEGRARMDRVRELARALEQRRTETVASLAVRIERTRGRTTATLAIGGLLTLMIALSALFAVRRDLRAMDAAARALEEGEQRFRLLAESASDLIRVFDRAGAMRYASPSSQRLLGYTPDELLGIDPVSLLPPDERARMREAIEGLLARDERPPPIVHRMQHQDGSLRWFETRIEPIRDEDGVVRRVHSASRDVGARVEADRALREQQAILAQEADQLREISHRDELTGRLNRRGLLEHGPGVLSAARAARKPAVAFFVDLDGLKEINDQLGHEEGDRALVDAASLLREVARASDIVARLGGDELVVLGVASDASTIDAFAERLAGRVERHNATEQRRYRLSISVGLSIWAPDDTRTLEELIADADAAMYEQKKGRRQARTSAGETIVREGGRAAGRD